MEEEGEVVGKKMLLMLTMEQSAAALVVVVVVDTGVKEPKVYQRWMKMTEEEEVGEEENWEHTRDQQQCWLEKKWKLLVLPDLAAAVEDSRYLGRSCWCHRTAGNCSSGLQPSCCLCGEEGGKVGKGNRHMRRMMEQLWL